MNNTGQQNLTLFLSHEEKYLILIVLLTLNSNMQVVFLPRPQFFCDSQVKWEKMCIFTYFTGKQNLTFFVPRGKIYNPDSTFNAEFKYVSSFSSSPTVFCDSQVKCEKRVKKCVHISLENKI
jgi:hypothetical protein